MPILSRRDLVRDAIGLSALGTCLPGAATSAAAGTPVLLGPRSDFDATFGAGVPEGTLTRYGDGSDGRAIYRVAFTAGNLALTIEGDFTNLPGGGFLDYQPEIGKTRFLPSGVTSGSTFIMGVVALGRSFFAATVYRGPSTGSKDAVLVLDELSTNRPDGAMGFYLPRTNIAAPVAPVFDPQYYGNAGSWPSPWAGVDAWHSAFGYETPSQSGDHISNPPIAGNFTLGRNAIEISFETPVSTTDAATCIGNMLPANTSLLGNWWLAPTESGPIGVRVYWFDSEGAQSVVLLYVTGNEKSGGVTRILHSAYLWNGTNL